MIETLTQMQQKLDRQPNLHRIGTLFSETVLLKIDSDEFYPVFEHGRIDRILEGP